MSHAAERQEKDCLNCGTTVQGRFCHVCGQENVVPRETFWKLVTHFFYDITHFDSKFFDSLRYLLFKPGFLSQEYNRGRRARYLNPIRMYVFTSAIFFLIFFSRFDSKNMVTVTGNEPFTRTERDSAIRALSGKLGKDSTDTNLKMQLLLLKDTTKEVRFLDLLPYTEGFTTVSTIGGRYSSLRAYDSIQKTLPPEKKDGWWRRTINRRVMQINDKYRYNPEGSFEKIKEEVLHRLPYLLFVSLPFFALILKLLYLRRKQFLYADHGIFTVHHYILSFILLLLVFLLGQLDDATGWGIWNTLMAVVFIAWPVYLFLAMKRFYGQGSGKTFVKFCLLNLMGLFTLAVLFGFFFLFSIIQL